MAAYLILVATWQIKWIHGLAYLLGVNCSNDLASLMFVVIWHIISTPHIWLHALDTSCLVACLNTSCLVACLGHLMLGCMLGNLMLGYMLRLLVLDCMLRLLMLSCMPWTPRAWLYAWTLHVWLHALDTLSLVACLGHLMLGYKKNIKINKLTKKHKVIKKKFLLSFLKEIFYKDFFSSNKIHVVFSKNILIRAFFSSKKILMVNRKFYLSSKKSLVVLYSSLVSSFFSLLKSSQKTFMLFKKKSRGALS